jgi:hypothetical protein
MTSPRTSRRRFYQRLVPLLLLLAASAFAVATARWALNRLPSTSLATNTSMSQEERLAASTRVRKNVDGSVTVDATKPAWRIWLDAWLASRRTPQAGSTQPNPAQPDATKTPQQPVWIDVEALARRHPSWQLADRLMARTTSPVPHITGTTPVSAPDVRSFAAAGENASFWQAFQNRGSVAGSGTPVRSGRRGFDLPSAQVLSLNGATSTRSSREAAFADAARARQERALRSLTNALGSNLSRERTLRAREAREILDEEVAAARALGLLPPEPILLSAEEQLELTNLRLKLLPSSRLSPEEEVVARRRYLYLQSRWDEALRRQETLHLAEIEEQREIEPRRLRTEGEAAIVQSQSRLQVADAARLQALNQAQNELIARDFAEWQPLRNASQGVTSLANAPASAFSSSPASALSQGRASSIGRSDLALLVLPRAIMGNVPNLSFGGATPVSGRVLDAPPQRFINNSQTVATLRAQARRDAQLWARIIAQREGWQRVFSPRSNDKKPVLNGTETVWRAWQS